MKNVAIVTGASRGIGAATALLLARSGYAVCVNYLNNQAAADAVVEDISEAGGEAFTFAANVAKVADVDALFTATQERFGSVTHLVNNVGILATQSALVDIDLERFNHIMQTNVNSCFLCCRAFVKQCEGNGAIVNVSSLASQTGSPFEYVDYAASKGAMDSLTKGLSLELAGNNIRVNAVRPGFIETEIHADGGEPDRVARLAPNIPMQRGGSADEVAQAILWLLSNDASYVTGSFIDIAGGR